MSKKYDNNLQEIKETRTFATNNTSTFFTCDTCGRSVGGITIVNGMRFCAKCYQDTFKDYYGASWQEVAELKQRLAEKDKEISMLKSQNQFFMEETKRLDQISNLKDKEIERLKDLNNFLTDQNKDLILDMGTAEYFGDKWKIIEVLDQIEKGE